RIIPNHQSMVSHNLLIMNEGKVIPRWARNNPALGIMAQGVRRRPAFAGEIGGVDGVGEGADQDMGGDGAGPSAVGEKQPPVALSIENCLRRSRWSCADHSRRMLSWTGLGTGTMRSLLPLPTTRNRPLVLSMAVTGRAAASLMRRPQAYIRRKQPQWIGLRMP